MRTEDIHSGPNQFLIPWEALVLRENISSMNEGKLKGQRIFKIVHFPFRVKDNKIQPEGCQLERPVYDFKNHFPLDFVYILGAKYIFNKNVLL